MLEKQNCWSVRKQSDPPPKKTSLLTPPFVVINRFPWLLEKWCSQGKKLIRFKCACVLNEWAKVTFYFFLNECNILMSTQRYI